MSPDVLIVGSDALGTLESSYGRAFAGLGWRVSFWDPVQVVYRYTRGGRLGRIASNFVRIEPWLMKVNRQLVVDVMNMRPQLILTFTHAQLLTGALAQIRAALDATLVQIWPDTMQNWRSIHSTNLPLYDLLATYSRATIPVFERLGAQRVAWLPLAADPELHPIHAPHLPDLTADVSFIGGWRPEREAILAQLEGFDLKIWGPEWDRHCRSNRFLMQAWQGRPLRGIEFAQAVKGSKINLNIIDPTNFPAANMRFFEIPIAGGLQVCSPCPELETEFRHGEHLFYYRHQSEVPELLHKLIADDTLRAEVASAGHEQVWANHTYTHRARQLLELLDQNHVSSGHFLR